MATDLVVPKLSASSVHLVARNPNEMALSRQCLKNWLDGKIASCRAELSELEEIRDNAIKNKWRSAGLSRQVGLATKRLTFYEKVCKAVDLGFTIVPNFPVDLFAVRVTRETPAAKANDSNYARPNIENENPSHAPAGEGEYVSPEQKLENWETTEKNGKGEEITRYHSCPVEFQDVEFPVACARPEIMTATAEAMSHKLFDAFGIAPQGVIRKRKYDPIILGLLQMPKVGYMEPKTVSFLIAWHLDLRTL
jgi:hypothetical protein